MLRRAGKLENVKAEMNSADRKKVEAFEMWTWRRVLKISWRDKVTNQEVLKRVEEERTLLHMIDRRKHRWLGHVMRGEGLLLTVIEGRMVGKTTRGRRRLNMLSDMVGGTTYVQTKRKAENRITWRESGRNRRSSVSQTCSSAED